MNGWNDSRLQGLDSAIVVDSNSNNNIPIAEGVTGENAYQAAVEHEYERLSEHREAMAKLEAKVRMDIEQGLIVDSPVMQIPPLPTSYPKLMPVESYPPVDVAALVNELKSYIKSEVAMAMGQSKSTNYSGWGLASILEELIVREGDIVSLYVQALKGGLPDDVAQFVNQQIAYKSQVQASIGSLIAILGRNVNGDNG